MASLSNYKNSALTSGSTAVRTAVLSPFTNTASLGISSCLSKKNLSELSKMNLKTSKRISAYNSLSRFKGLGHDLPSALTAVPFRLYTMGV